MADKVMAQAFLRLLGFDPADVHSATIRPTCVVVHTIDRHTDGRPVVVDDAVSLTRHELAWER